KAGLLKFFGKHQALRDRAAFEAYLKPHRKSEWVVYAKAPFGGPEAVLAYLSQYTHRVAISNSRLIKLENGFVTFSCKDYRKDGPDRYGTKSLPVAEFIRRFLMHVLPKGFHRIRHYGLLANGNRAANIAWARELLGVDAPAMEPGDNAEDKSSADPEDPNTLPQPCPCCGGAMIVIEVFEPGCQPKCRPATEGIDSS
ncbi:MAG: IS91 family transposase, partial [Alphaproteobacteria bacterium]|nr:IS91 family transposase [Alphaproteobacteria bacterium]